MIDPIENYGQPVMEKRRRTSGRSDSPELHKLVENMLIHVRRACVGLAAAAIGISLRIAVIDSYYRGGFRRRRSR